MDRRPSGQFPWYSEAQTQPSQIESAMVLTYIAATSLLIQLRLLKRNFCGCRSTGHKKAAGLSGLALPTGITSLRADLELTCALPCGSATSFGRWLLYTRCLLGESLQGWKSGWEGGREKEGLCCYKVSAQLAKLATNQVLLHAAAKSNKPFHDSRSIKI